MVKLPVEMQAQAEMRQEFGERVEFNAPLARLTSARLGGPADALVSVNSSVELAEAAAWRWSHHLPWIILGGGSNLLVSDAGVRGVVVLNRARQVEFDRASVEPSAWAESGANFGLLARQAAAYGLAGLEWAVGIPGTVGGAVVGNAGAHGADMASNLMVAEILQHEGCEQLIMGGQEYGEQWPVGRLEYGYRSSILKRASVHGRGASACEYVVLRAQLRLAHSSQQVVQEQMDGFSEHRRRTQPPGATMGSMFKNPPGDYAGRLIDTAGLKGSVSGDAQISPVHANFFINRGQATATDFYRLIKLAQQAVLEQTGIRLELEIELVGEWEGLGDGK